MGSIVGYRFHPTPEELINHYLRKKRLNPDFSVKKIKEIDLYKYEPFELLGLLPVEADVPEGHFFCEPDYKFGNRKRVNRRTKGGNWKVTGKKRDIKDKRKRVIGWKITLVFYNGSDNSREARTNWVMHEYHINDDPAFKREFVVVRIRRNPNTKYKAPLTPNGGVPSTDMASSSGNQSPAITTSQVESQLQQEPQPLANHEISFCRTSQLLPNSGFSQNGETQTGTDRVLDGNSQLLSNYNEQVNDGWNSQSAFDSGFHGQETRRTHPRAPEDNWTTQSSVQIELCGQETGQTQDDVRNPQSVVQNEFHGQETGHYHPLNEWEHDRRKSLLTVYGDFYGQEIGHCCPLRVREDDKRNSQSAVQTEFCGQETGQSHPTDFSLSKPVTGDSFYYGSDEAITALDDGSSETITALLKGFSSMAYEYDFNSMCQSQVLSSI